MSIKTFVKDHKKELAYGAAGVVGVAAVVGAVKLKSKIPAIAAKHETTSPLFTGLVHWVKPEQVKATEKLTEIGFGNLDKYVDAANYAYEGVHDAVALSDLGKLGEALAELEGFSETDKVFILFSLKHLEVAT